MAKILGNLTCMVGIKKSWWVTPFLAGCVILYDSGILGSKHHTKICKIIQKGMKVKILKSK